MNFFKRLSKRYHRTDPVEYIMGPIILPTLEYDDLYENQTRLDGTAWKKFEENYKLKYIFHDDLRDVDLDRDIICLWFFRERSDRDPGTDIKLAGKILTYLANSILITPCKQIKIKERNKIASALLLTWLTLPGKITVGMSHFDFMYSKVSSKQSSVIILPPMKKKSTKYFLARFTC